MDMGYMCMMCVYMMYMYMQAFVNVYMCATNGAKVRGQPWSFFTLTFQLFGDKGLFVVHHCCMPDSLVCEFPWILLVSTHHLTLGTL